MRDLLFLLAFLGVILFGYYLAGRLGRSIKKYYKGRKHQTNPNGNGIMIFTDKPSRMEEALMEPSPRKAEGGSGSRSIKWSRSFNRR